LATRCRPPPPKPLNPPPPKGSTKYIPKLTEDVVHVHAASTKATSTLKCLVSKLVIPRSSYPGYSTLRMLPQPFLKFFLSFLIARIFVRVIL
jgi:hypothetical protein